MVKKTKNILNNPDHVESAQETQMETLTKLNKLQEKFYEIEMKVDVAEEKYKRVLADYQNQARRHKEQESAIIRMASAILIEKLLLSLDSLQMAQSHLKDKGLQMVIDQFLTTFAEEGLSPIESDGKDFDPLTMDCTEVVPGKKDRVIETVSPGYYLNEKVLRPAKVKVGSGDPVFPPPAFSPRPDRGEVEGSHSINK